MHGPRRHGNAHEFDHYQTKTPWWKQAHRDWRVWTGVVLMTIAMLVYVFSFDLIFRPGSPQPQAPVPAAP